MFLLDEVLKTSCPILKESLTKSLEYTFDIIAFHFWRTNWSLFLQCKYKLLWDSAQLNCLLDLHSPYSTPYIKLLHSSKICSINLLRTNILNVAIKRKLRHFRFKSHNMLVQMWWLHTGSSKASFISLWRTVKFSLAC